MATADKPATKGKAPPRFEQFYAVRRFQLTLAFTPDGRKLLFSSDISGQFNLWRVSVRGGWPEQNSAQSAPYARAREGWLRAEPLSGLSGSRDAWS